MIYGEEKRLLPWAAMRIGIESFRADAVAIGIESSGQVRGVVIFDTFSPHDCMIHVASDGSGHWLTRKLLVATFAYVFIQCGFRRVTSTIPEGNTRSLRFNLHLGFEREGLHPFGAGDEAMITLGMRRENCRFIPKSHQHMRA